MANRQGALRGGTRQGRSVGAGVVAGSPSTSGSDKGSGWADHPAFEHESVDLVPHTGIAERVRGTPAEHDSSGGVRLSPADSGSVQGTNKGTHGGLNGTQRQPIGADERKVVCRERHSMRTERCLLAMESHRSRPVPATVL